MSQIFFSHHHHRHHHDHRHRVPCSYVGIATIPPYIPLRTPELSATRTCVFGTPTYRLLVRVPPLPSSPSLSRQVETDKESETSNRTLPLTPTLLHHRPSPPQASVLSCDARTYVVRRQHWLLSDRATSNWPVVFARPVPVQHPTTGKPRGQAGSLTKTVFLQVSRSVALGLVLGKLHAATPSYRSRCTRYGNSGEPSRGYPVAGGQ